MLPCIILIPICALTLVLSRHLSRAICACLVLLSSIILNIIFKPTNIWMLVLSIVLSSAILYLYAFLQTKIKYDFTRKIISFTYIFNSILKPRRSNGDRIVGKVMPYSNYQLRYNGKLITMNEITSAGITLISGSTGSGKTTQVISFIKQNIVDGKSVIFSEYKGDPKVISEIVDFASNYGFKIFNLSSGKSNFNYDPLKNLNNVGRMEAIINMRKWSLDGSDAHYKLSVQIVLQKLLADFSHKYKDGSFTIQFFEYLKSYHPARDEWDAYSTISRLMELLLTSSLKPMFSYKNGQTLDFSKIKNERFILVVSFVSSNKELATSFSSLMFRDLLDECTVEAPDKNINLYIDEFGTLENPFIIKDVLEKGRSGKIATTLTLLDINQIVIKTNQAYLDSMLGIINTFIIYNGATRVTAEKFAGVQLLDIENVLMNLRKPINGKPPTAIYISKYPTLNKRINSEVFRFEPYNFKDKGSKNHQISKTKIGNFDDTENYGAKSEYNESIHENLNREAIAHNSIGNAENVETNGDRFSYDDFI